MPAILKTNILVTIKEARSKKAIEDFIMFPFDLYKDDPNWVPPLIFDEKNTFNREKNPSFEFCDVIFLLAFKNNKLVGRVVGIINHKSNKKWKDNLTRFGWIEYIDDFEVSKALLDAVEKWGKAKGMKGIHGPLGFTDLDKEGMMVEGFQNKPAITTAYNHPYFAKHLYKHGYRKSVDWIQYKFNASQPIPEKVARINKLISEKYNLRTIIPKTKKEIKKYIPGFFKALNASFKDLYGYNTLNEKQKKYYTDAYFNFARPELLCFIVDEDDTVVAFGILFPSMSDAFKKANGKLLPFGFIHILKALKNYDEIDLYFNGVLPEWQNKGIHSLYYAAMNQVAIERGVKTAISLGQLETNYNAVRIWNNYEKEPYFRTRCFIKEY